jgi:hypothetical protein
MKKILLLILFSLLFSCQDKFNPNNFKGTWISLDSNESFNEILPTFTFKNDSVYLEDVYSFLLKGKYVIKRNTITTYYRSDTITKRFNFNNKDSIITIGKDKYSFWEGYSYDSKFIEYNLINIKRKKKITSDSLRKLDCAMHLIKDSNDSLLLKVNDKTTSNFDIIPRFVTLADKFEYTFPGVYIGEKNKLIDLLNIYIRFWSINIKRSMLILEFDLKNNSYSNFLDEFYFWDYQILKYYEKQDEKNEIPISRELSRNQYLKMYGSKVIKINSDIDFNKLNYINKENNYLIQINTNMSIESYISLKEKISEIKKCNKIIIRTEYNLFLPNQ